MRGQVWQPDRAGRGAQAAAPAGGAATPGAAGRPHGATWALLRGAFLGPPAERPEVPRLLERLLRGFTLGPDSLLSGRDAPSPRAATAASLLGVSSREQGSTARPLLARPDLLPRPPALAGSSLTRRFSALLNFWVWGRRALGFVNLESLRCDKHVATQKPLEHTWKRLSLVGTVPRPPPGAVSPEVTARPPSPGPWEPSVWPCPQGHSPRQPPGPRIYNLLIFKFFLFFREGKGEGETSMRNTRRLPLRSPRWDQAHTQARPPPGVKPGTSGCPG